MLVCMTASLQYIYIYVEIYYKYVFIYVLYVNVILFLKPPISFPSLDILSVFRWVYRRIFVKNRLNAINMRLFDRNISLKVVTAQLAQDILILCS